MARVYFKYPKWAAVLAFVGGCISLYVAYIMRLDEWWLPSFYVGFSLICFLACLETLISYLALEETVLRYRLNFKRKIIKKAEIEKVTWEGGCGMSVLLKSGGWVPIPTFGNNSQGITNSVRAWLRK